MNCWVCGFHAMKKIYDDGDKISLKPSSFKITDSHYGTTLSRYKCKHCGFVQCNITDVTSFYENLEDSEYIESEDQRNLQFIKLLDSVEKYIPDKARILDIGAGSGMFVKEALKRGYDVVGVEPSEYLVNQAESEGLPVIKGTFPESLKGKGKYDVIFMTDVIEHIADPLKMLSYLPKALKDNGIVIVTTPNVSSIAARVLGRRWWHYRIAHIGYYNKRTLKIMMHRAGMKPVKFMYAKWFFSSGYILERLRRYIPFIAPIEKVAPKNIMIPVNLFDSMLVIFKRK